MNKKLIALAVAGVTVAPAALAQTANPVTLYGRVILSLESVESKGAAPQRTRVQDNSSFLGVRGTEDLGSGLKAFFQLETAFPGDQAAAAFANRNSGIGLQGGWGSVLIGRWDAPFKAAHYAVDAYGDVTIGGITQVGNDQGNFDRRPANVLQYWSPTLGGFNLKASYQAEELKNASTNPWDQSYSVTFNRGPVYFFGAWEEHKDQVGSTPTAGKKEEGLSVGGTYTFGPVRAGGVWQEYKKTDRTKKNSYLANAIWTVGSHQFIYQYQKSEKGGLTTSTVQPECDSNAVTWRYNFSKRTITDLTYVKIDNNAAGNCGNSNGTFGAIVATGSDPQGISLGIRHLF